jgi:hypothetical protein
MNDFSSGRGDKGFGSSGVWIKNEFLLICLKF